MILAKTFHGADYRTQTVARIKTREYTGHRKQHFMTISPVTYVTNDIQCFLKCCIKSPVHLVIRPGNISFARLQPVSGTLVLFKHIPISYILIW